LCASRLLGVMDYEKKPEQYRRKVTYELINKRNLTSGEISHMLLNDTVLLQLNMTENHC
jgi:hypothetical protein